MIEQLPCNRIYAWFLHSNYEMTTPPWTRNETIIIRRAEVLHNEVFHHILTYINDYAWELAQQVSSEAVKKTEMTRLEYSKLEDIPYLSGGQFLLLAAEYVARDKLDKLSVKLGWDKIQHIYIHLAQAFDINTATDFEQQSIIERLRDFSPQTLKALLPVAAHAKVVLATALG